MAISLHPYITGAAHRIRYLEELYRYILDQPDVAMWTGAEIANWYRGEIAKAELAGEFEAIEQLNKQLASDRKVLEAELEEKKNELRA